MNRTTPDAYEDAYTTRVRRAARRIFGSSTTGRELARLCEEHMERRQKILHSRGGELTVIAVVGATGQGKTWLVRGFVNDPAVLERIPSGDLAQQRTEVPVWIGPSAPVNYDPQVEKYLACDAQHMHAIGSPYLIVDTPGSTDVQPSVAEAAARTLAEASIQLLTVRRDALRSLSTSQVASLGEGSVIVPVVTAVDSDESARVDVDAFLDSLHAASGKSEILTPVLIPDYERRELRERDVVEAAVAEITDRLAPYVGVSRETGRRIASRLDAIDVRFRLAVRDELATRLPALSAAVDSLDAEAGKIPDEIAHSLIGGQTTLEVGVRSRLRLALLHRTSGLWFPYRSLLGTLNLTHGAWDRLVLAISGSLPSFVGAVWTGVRNVSDAQHAAAQLRGDVAGRAAEMVRDRLRPSVARFRRQLAAVRDNEDAKEASRPDDARLAGLGQLQDATQEILEHQVASNAASTIAAQALGLAGTALFWLLLSGPIVTLYRSYGTAAFDALRGTPIDWNAFPQPTAAMLLTSVILSVLPVAIYAMIVLSWAQSRRRVAKTVRGIRHTLDEKIQQLREEEVLRLEFDDPLLEDARLLLSEAKRVEHT